LARAFLEGAAGSTGPPDLEARLAAVCLRGRAAYPSLAVDDAVFARHLGRCAVGSADAPPPDLEDLQIEDLFLACACLERVPGAAEAFDARCAERLRRALASSVKADDARAEVAQRVREAVLVGNVDAPAKIANYSGQGPLDRWVAIVAQRMAITLARSETASRRAHERATLEAAVSGQQQPEISYIKEQYKDQFERAFAEALTALSERDRLLMRLHLVSGMSVESIGKMYNVSQSTASRWLASARETVAAEVERLLRDRLQLARSEMASLAGLVASRLDLSISRILAPTPPAPSRK
jgi:RNA polymerase sigma-70 factor (ECF subfamily)